MELSRNNALYGAAYHVLFGRKCPDYCHTREHLKELRDDLAIVMAWAETQSDDVAGAYKRAATDIEKRAVSFVENNERAAHMRSIRDSIPKPPELR